MIMAGEKTREIRPWPTDHRGQLFIVAPAIDARTREFFSPHLPHGAILGCIDLIDCQPIADTDVTCADDCGGFYKFLFRRPQTLMHPIPIRAGLHIFSADIDATRLHFGPPQPSRPEHLT